MSTGKVAIVTGGAKGCGSKALRQTAADKGCPVLGEFGCSGYDTFGPFKLAGGIAKRRPSEQDLEQARAFYRGAGITVKLLRGYQNGYAPFDSRT